MSPPSDCTHGHREDAGRDAHHLPGQLVGAERVHLGEDRTLSGLSVGAGGSSPPTHTVLLRSPLTPQCATQVQHHPLAPLCWGPCSSVILALPSISPTLLPSRESLCPVGTVWAAQSEPGALPAHHAGAAERRAGGCAGVVVHGNGTHPSEGRPGEQPGPPPSQDDGTAESSAGSCGRAGHAPWPPAFLLEASRGLSSPAPGALGFLGPSRLFSVCPLPAFLPTGAWRSPCAFGVGRGQAVLTVSPTW